MSRKFIATIVVAAITVTGFSAAPARADQDDIAKLLFGAATIYMISRAVKDDKRQVGTPAPVTRPRPLEPRPLPRRVRRFDPIPSKCLKHHETRDGVVRMIGQRCVQKRYRHASYLPEKCHFKVRTYDGKRAGYRPRCLRKNGFVLNHG